MRAPALHGGLTDAPPPERYVEHEVQEGETLTEVSHRYQTEVPMLEAANPQVPDPDQIDIGQRLNVPIGEGYGREPTQGIVAPGQSLTDMARQYPGVSASDIVGANRHRMADPDLVFTGQKVWVPADKPPTALEQKVKATDQAMQTLKGAERTYDELATSDASPARLRLHENLEGARGGLKTATGAELEERVRAAQPPGAEPGEAVYQSAGQQIAQRYQASPAESAKLDHALGALATGRETARVQTRADGIVGQARRETDPAKALQALNDGLKTAPPEVRAAALSSANGQAVVQSSVDWATEPMGEKGIHGKTPVYNAFDGPLESQQAMGRLDEVTRHLDPALAAQVAGQSLPAFETYSSAARERFGTIAGNQQMRSALNVLERGLDTPAGQANMDRILKMGMWHAPAVAQHIAEGGRPDYALAFGRQPKQPEPVGDPAGIARSVIDSGTAQFRQKVAEHGRAYAEHMQEVGWLIQNQGGTMTPDQLQQAVADYAKSKGPEWEAEGKRMQQQLAQDGEKLLTQVSVLGQGTNAPATRDASAQAIEKTLQDPAARTAISTALKTNPALTTGVLGERMLDLFANPNVSGPAKLLNRVTWLGQDFATAYVKANVLQQMEVGTLHPRDYDSIEQAKQALNKMRDTRFAKLMGVSPTQMNQAVDALDEIHFRRGDTFASLDQRIKKLSDTLDGIKGLEKTTLPGQLVRAAGIGMAGVGLLASSGKALDDPSLLNMARVLSDSAGLAWRGADIAIGKGVLDAESRLGLLGSSAFARFTGVLGAAVDAYTAYDAFSKGDAVSGGLFAAQGAGMLAATFAAGGPVGWIGLGVMVAAAAGLWFWNEHKAHSTHETQWDGGRSRDFLAHAGIQAPAADTLSDQSSDGHSVVPLLARYAQTQGLDLRTQAGNAAFADWINKMDAAQLGQLKDRLHATANRLEGDADRFGATATDDASYQPSKEVYRVGGRAAYKTVEYPSALSAVQLEKVLQQLGVPAL
ncbi:LysM peptidoglycan-binding domain-containing protein [Ottowia testudinis]|uniref:LysM peptidoglycan-binding domain-containing protein n=1 Tax=Ottowia testudinis TaxID=2816950 RepID=A0A975CJE6_9BURK|nr:LysM domain-containing protein [Ottowia testudinis]QTD46181.1 LysM peptidoglycan-binding domain-containing protein [Ottowia testudinis]